MTRDEHLAWAKRRALLYLDRGDMKEAFTSMGSDLQKHSETKLSDNAVLWQLGLNYVMNRDMPGLRRWIEGFN